MTMVKPNLTWLVGRWVKSVSKEDYTWSFLFDDGSLVITEAFWRLVSADGVTVTSEDHGHPFGLPVPVDAGEVAKKRIEHKPVERLDLDERTGDLSLCFTDGIALQFLTVSCGYDGWHTIHGDQEVISLGGGRIRTFTGETQG